jgi:hypothetical protein
MPGSNLATISPGNDFGACCNLGRLEGVSSLAGASGSLSREVVASSWLEDFGGGMLNFDDNLRRSEGMSPLMGTPGPLSRATIVSSWLVDFGGDMLNLDGDLTRSEDMSALRVPESSSPRAIVVSSSLEDLGGVLNFEANDIISGEGFEIGLQPPAQK